MILRDDHGHDVLDRCKVVDGALGGGCSGGLDPVEVLLEQQQKARDRGHDQQDRDHDAGPLVGCPEELEGAHEGVIQCMGVLLHVSAEAVGPRHKGFSSMKSPRPGGRGVVLNPYK